MTTTTANLYDECKDMLTGSILVYGFAKLRNLARQGKLAGDDAHRIMDLPLSAGEVGNVVLKNRESLQHTKNRDEAKWLLSILEHTKKNDMEAGTAAKLMIFADDFEDSDLVYGIVVNQARKRITIVFRGSATINDFLTDASTRLRKIHDPLHNDKETGKVGNLGIHCGFYGYLFEGDKDPKFNQLMVQIDELRKENPGFKLYFTGHSLGGALATFMTFCVAASLPNEHVICYTFGSPKVGNLAFRRAFQSLEQQGRISCLRVSNDGDSVTRMPDLPAFMLRIPDCSGCSCLFAWSYMCCCQKNMYRHVGINLKLKSGNRFKIAPSSQHVWKISVFCRDFWRKSIRAIYTWLTLPFALFFCCAMTRTCRDPWGCNVVAHHVPGIYMENLDGVKEKLEKKTLEGLYKKRRPRTKAAQEEVQDV